MKQFPNFPGQTLIETLAALSIIALVMSAIGVVVTSSLSNAEYNQAKTLSVKYAQQGSEIVRQLRDDSYTNFTKYHGTYCLSKGQTTLGQSQTNCASPNIGNFIRSVQIQQGGCGANVAQVIVTVSFKDGKCQGNTYCHKQVSTSCLSTLNPIPTV